MPLIGYANHAELVTETLLVGGLQQTWTQMAMDLDTSSDHNLGTIPKTSRLPAFMFHTAFIDPGQTRLRRCTANA